VSAANTERVVRDAVSSEVAIALPAQAIRGIHDRVNGVRDHASPTARFDSSGPYQLTAKLG